MDDDFRGGGFEEGVDRSNELVRSELEVVSLVGRDVDGGLGGGGDGEGNKLEDGMRGSLARLRGWIIKVLQPICTLFSIKNG